MPQRRMREPRMQQLIFRYLFVSLSIAASATYAFASSTNETQQTAKVTCSSSTAHTFDFLIGEWMGTEEHETPSHGGPPAGPTQFKIEGAVNGCVLHEICVSIQHQRPLRPSCGELTTRTRTSGLYTLSTTPCTRRCGLAVWKTVSGSFIGAGN